ncbi:MAG: transcriptional regulator [Kineosporiaceae bacterium]|nr:transcriptional regulator [Aeromicrobium sp.]
MREFFLSGLGVSDATLSKQTRALITTGLATSTKIASASRADFRRMTWLRLTAAGKNAFDDHIRALRKISVGFDIRESPKSRS